MNIRVALLLSGALALAGGALAVAQKPPPASPTVGESALAATVTSNVDNSATPPQAASQDKPAATSDTPTIEPRPAVTAAPKGDEPVEASTPPTKTPEEQAAPVADTTPADGAPPADKKPAAAAPAKAATPVVTAPPAKTEAPVAAKPKSEEPASAVATPPAPSEQPAAAKTMPAEKPAAVVTKPSPAPEKPAAAKPPEKQPAPVVTTTPPATEKPAAATPAQAPQPVVEAPTPSPKPTIVMTPLPEKRPKITKALIERTEPAKYLFAAEKLPSVGRARAIGYYPKGCLAGGVELPVNGPNWQVMRLSRNRNWGHPELIRFLEHFAPLAAKVTHWPGILIGDMAQPRGGPLPSGHRSHQVGLDVDIWFRPMPDHRLSRKQRETISATSLVASDWKHLNPKTWTPADAAFIKAAAEQPEVERIFVNAVIKKELCRLDGKHDPAWLGKVRPWYGHRDHMHVRLKCPASSPHCRHQPPVPGGDGCSHKALAFWFSDRVLHPKPAKHPKPPKQIMLADLPHACKLVLNAPAKRSHLASEDR